MCLCHSLSFSLSFSLGLCLCGSVCFAEEFPPLFYSSLPLSLRPLLTGGGPSRRDPPSGGGQSVRAWVCWFQSVRGAGVAVGVVVAKRTRGAGWECRRARKVTAVARKSCTMSSRGRGVTRLPSLTRRKVRAPGGHRDEDDRRPTHTHFSLWVESSKEQRLLSEVLQHSTLLTVGCA